ncbi:MAG: hypothetical protein LBM97_01535 [Candidatus Nomurabacteria bacterium]|jgi:hypothetical protein|nr:hypothetical protein [Candidatus Nomurabacteria bacterium]
MVNVNVRRDKKMETGRRGGFFAWLRFFVLAVVLGVIAIAGVAIVTYVFLTANFNKKNEGDPTMASTVELREMFEAYGLAAKAMPTVLPVYQSVNGRELDIEVQNELTGLQIDKSFAGVKTGWVSFALQAVVRNNTAEEIKIADRLTILADSLIFPVTDVSGEFLEENGFVDISDATVPANGEMRGWIGFYMRGSARYSTFLQLHESDGGLKLIDISEK